MNIKLLLILSSITIFGVFTLLSYTVAKESWQTLDFNTTVKLQDHISRRFDIIFSYFSLIGSAEVTIGLAGVLAVLSLFRLKILAFIGWLLIIPASSVEIFGKLFVFHPGPPVLFHRTLISTNLPSFYVHTNYSYPSGHMTRTFFLVTIFVAVALFNLKGLPLKLALILGALVLGFMMVLTRIYLGEHWFSDVAGGSLLGVSVGLFSSALIIQKKS